MAITSLTGLNNAQSQQALQNANAKLQAVIAGIVSGTTGGDVATLSTATQLQSETSGLKQVSSNLTQAISLTQVADGGAGQIQAVLGQLQSLASQAGSSVLNADTRKQINQQFQQLSGEINQLASDTSFNSQPLLNGNLSGNNALSFDSLMPPNSGGSSSGTSLSISDLSTGGLFGGQALDLSTPAGAQQAFTAIGNAINKVTGARAGIGAFQQTLDFAAANVDSAITNQQAAQATLSETDLASASTQMSLDNIHRNAAIAVAAQGNLLSPTLLQLIG